MKLNRTDKKVLKNVIHILRREKYPITADFLQELIIKILKEDKNE